MASTCDVPILILHEKEDGYTEPAGSKRLFETIGSCDKRLSLYEHGRHELLNDLDQDHAYFEILSWIDTLYDGTTKNDRVNVRKQTS